MIEIIELFNPPEDAMVRKFTCFFCQRRHMKDGGIVTVWDSSREVSHVASQKCAESHKSPPECPLCKSCPENRAGK